jgi:DNA-binding MarR family transcriptional regulator
MRKVIKYPKELSTADKVNILSSLQKIGLSDTESAVLAEIIEHSQNNNITLSVSITKQIRDTLNISATSFNTSLHRLEQKGTIKKEGRTIILNPLYNKLQEITELLICLTPPATNEKN